MYNISGVFTDIQQHLRLDRWRRKTEKQMLERLLNNLAKQPELVHGLSSLLNKGHRIRQQRQLMEEKKGKWQHYIDEGQRIDVFLDIAAWICKKYGIEVEVIDISPEVDGVSEKREYIYKFIIK